MFRGGGIRKLNFFKLYKKGEILEEVKFFFFLEGKFLMGIIEDFVFLVVDFL